MKKRGPAKANVIPVDKVVERLRAELNRCKGSWLKLAIAADGAFHYKWLVGFATGRIKKPGFDKVVILGKYLGIKLRAENGPHFLKFNPDA